MDTAGPAFMKVTAAPSSTVHRISALLLWLGGIHFVVLLLVLSLLCLPFFWICTLFGLLISLMVIPLYEHSGLAVRVARFICRHAPSHFPMTLVVEDMEAFDPNRAYIIAAEPHSILPIGILVLCNYSGHMPFAKMKALASSIVFFIPFLRHIWSWLGLVPASMNLLLKLLKSGYTCIIIPGGVKEVLYMEHDREVIYLNKRYGFIRAAIQTGSPLVPSFMFGQTSVYHWWKPKGKLYDHLSRAICFAPLVFWGMFGSPIPYQKPVYVVLGKPIEVNKNSEPSYEEVKEVHTKFTSSLQEIFDRHKVAAEYKDTHLYIY
eukprot:c22431_g1_i1 orf=312-1268(+)